MPTDKIRKYILPNIPYLFIGWACLKLGTAYRLAAGAGFGEKLLGLGRSIGPAFADFAPGLDPFDWLVGLVGAVAFRLLIYFKSKNAKKYRRDEEYGSARWGTEKDIKPFVDPKFENNIILTGTEIPQPQRLRHRLVRLWQDPVLAHAPAAPGAQLLCVRRSERGCPRASRPLSPAAGI